MYNGRYVFRMRQGRSFGVNPESTMPCVCLVPRLLLLLLREVEEPCSCCVLCLLWPCSCTSCSGEMIGMRHNSPLMQFGVRHVFGEIPYISLSLSLSTSPSPSLYSLSAFIFNTCNQPLAIKCMIQLYSHIMLYRILVLDPQATLVVSPAPYLAHTS